MTYNLDKGNTYFSGTMVGCCSGTYRLRVRLFILVRGPLGVLFFLVKCMVHLEHLQPSSRLASYPLFKGTGFENIAATEASSGI